MCLSGYKTDGHQQKLQFNTLENFDFVYDYIRRSCSLECPLKVLNYKYMCGTKKGPKFIVILFVVVWRVKIWLISAKLFLTATSDRAVTFIFFFWGILTFIYLCYTSLSECTEWVFKCYFFFLQNWLIFCSISSLWGNNL